jgi:hypothetical protein
MKSTNQDVLANQAFLNFLSFSTSAGSFRCLWGEARSLVTKLQLFKSWSLHMARLVDFYVNTLGWVGWPWFYILLIFNPSSGIIYSLVILEIQLWLRFYCRLILPLFFKRLLFTLNSFKNRFRYNLLS